MTELGPAAAAATAAARNAADQVIVCVCVCALLSCDALTPCNINDTLASSMATQWLSRDYTLVRVAYGVHARVVHEHNAQQTDTNARARISGARAPQCGNHQFRLPANWGSSSSSSCSSDVHI